MGLMANYKNIKIEINGHVGCVTLDRQKDNNALKESIYKKINYIIKKKMILI